MTNRVRIICIGLIFLCMSFIGSCSKNVDLTSTDKKNIALIVKMNNGYYWGTVKLGADTAAREFNVNVDYNAPGDEEDVTGQIKLVNQALEKNVDALILAASDYNALAEVTEKANVKHIPVIIIDSDVNSNKIYCNISTDNFDAGIKTGNLLVDIAGGNKLKVAVVSFVKGSRNAQQREAGLLSIISHYPKIQLAATEYCSSNESQAIQLTKNLVSNYKDIGAIVAFNDISSQGVAEAVDQMGLAGQIKIIGFDSAPKEIDYLESGVIQSTIIQNPFSMGYLGVKYALEAINGNTVPKYINTGAKIIDMNNMYLPENQKLVFPIVK